MINHKYIRFWDSYETVQEQDLRDYKIIATATGEWASIDSADARERIRDRHEYDNFK